MIAFVLAMSLVVQDVPTHDEIHGYEDLMLVELAEGKVDLISRVMELDEDQGAKFWNLYQEYEIELFGLGDRRLALLEEFRSALLTDGLDESMASELVTRHFAIKDQRAELIVRYHDLMSEQLNPISAAQFLQLESRFNLIIDLLFAADTPLIAAPQVLAETGALTAKIESSQEPDLVSTLDRDAMDSEEHEEHEAALFVCLGLAALSLVVLLMHLAKSEPARKLLPAGVCLLLSGFASFLLWSA